MRQQVVRVTVAAALVVLMVPASGAAQMTHRLKGFLRTEAGAPIANASIRADALSGFRGEPFAGQKDFTVTTTAPDMLPAVLILPVKFSQRQQVSAIGNTLTWQLPLTAAAAKDHPLLSVAAHLLADGKREEAAQALTVALGPDVSTPTRIIAGEMALLGRDWETAGKLLWDARDLAPKDLKQALAAAIDDLRGISRVQ